jgi:hypothetical protein
MTPTVGRLVHFYDPKQSDDLTPLAALVTQVTLRDEGKRQQPDWNALDEANYKVSLRVFHPGDGNTVDVTDAPFSAQPQDQHWSWPPLD